MGFDLVDVECRLGTFILILIVLMLIFDMRSMYYTHRTIPGIALLQQYLSVDVVPIKSIIQLKLILILILIPSRCDDRVDIDIDVDVYLRPRYSSYWNEPVY